MTERQDARDRRLFLAGVLGILFLYVALMICNIVFGGGMKLEQSSGSGLYQMDLRIFNSPFRIFWMFQIEWMLPLLLVLAYVLMIRKYNRAAVVTVAALVGSALTALDPRRGMDVYLYPSRWPGNVWDRFNPDFGALMYVFYRAWIFLSIVAVCVAPVLIKYSQKKKAFTKILLWGSFLFALSEGLPFLILYGGLYTGYFLLRCVLVLALVLWCLRNMKQTETCTGVKKKPGGLSKPLIGLIVVAVVYFLYCIVGMHLNKPNDGWSIESVMRYSGGLFRQTFRLFPIAWLFSLYYVKKERTAGYLLLLSAISVLLFVRWTSLLMTGATTPKLFYWLLCWLVFLFPLMETIWKNHKWLQNVYLLIVCGLALCFEVGFGMIKMEWITRLIMTLLYIAVFFLGVCGNKKQLPTGTEEVLLQKQDQKRNQSILFLTGVYAFLAILYFYVFKESGVETILGYFFPILVVLTLLFASTGSLQMYQGSAMMVMGTLYYQTRSGTEVEVLMPDGLKYYPGCSAWSMVFAGIIFLLPFLEELFPHRKRILRTVCMSIVAFGMFCRQILPLYKMELQEYRIWIYLLCQGILVILWVIAFKSSREDIEAEEKRKTEQRGIKKEETHAI